MEFFNLIKQNNLGHLLLSGNFGLEKENLRTDSRGHLALTPHPEVFGDKASHPYVTTDFAESQIEMVTPTFATPKETLNFMEALHDLVSLELKDEYLWPYSLPPILPDDDDLIKEAQFLDPEITEYRQYLAHKYGKRKQLLSGVHFNFSFSDKFMQLMYCANPGNLSFREFGDQVYLKLARFYLKFCWLPIYLFGANSVAHESYIACCKRPKDKINSDSYSFNGSSSFRNGVSGYRNLEYFYISYNSLYDYIADIKQAISDGQIIAPKEYYSQIRLKGQTKGSILEDLHSNGINYIEIRTLDLNPLTKVGITAESLEFIHLMLVYALLAPDFNMMDEEYQLANQNQILAADGNRDESILLHSSLNGLKDLREWGSEFMQQMAVTLKEFGMPAEKLQLINDFKNQLEQKEISSAKIISQQVIEHGYSNFFMQRSAEYLAMTRANYAKFCGFEDLELSTQILLKESIKRGISFKFLDRQDNFIELNNGKIRQIIKQATKTALDSYITIQAMENKLVTKKILTKAGIFTPESKSYEAFADAILDYPLCKNKSVVIKPNATDFGIGITIFKKGFSFEDYQEALILAFKYGSRVLVEDLIKGREYRFFVIEGQTVAILNREPANVVGDGIHSIRELVMLKNSDPLRAIGYKTPLERISLGETERVILGRQGFEFSSVPEAGNKVYLRENSNISTGGDSLDFTDIIPQSYKRIAVKAAACVGAVICGVDMIIKNIANPYPENNYAVIELNYNPAIHIHSYPYQGEDRKIAALVLKALKLID